MCQWKIRKLTKSNSDPGDIKHSVVCLARPELQEFKKDFQIFDSVRSSRITKHCPFVLSFGSSLSIDLEPHRFISNLQAALLALSFCSHSYFVKQREPKLLRLVCLLSVLKKDNKSNRGVTQPFFVMTFVCELNKFRSDR